MESQQAQQIVKALAQGIDPHTGDTYAADSPYQHPQTVRALYIALEAMQVQAAIALKRKPLPANAGKPWTIEEDRYACARFDGGATPKEIAVEFERTEWAVKTRLAKLGKIEADPARPA